MSTVQKIVRSLILVLPLLFAASGAAATDNSSCNYCCKRWGQECHYVCDEPGPNGTCKKWRKVCEQVCKQCAGCYECGMCDKPQSRSHCISLQWVFYAFILGMITSLTDSGSFSKVAISVLS